MQEAEISAWMDKTMLLARDAVVSWRGYMQPPHPGAVLNPLYADLNPTEINMLGGMAALLFKVVQGYDKSCQCPSCKLAAHARQSVGVEEKPKNEEWKPLS